MSFLNHLINGVSLGSVYAIIALGYTMVYGIAKMLNFAHGDIIMVGAYICFFAVSSFGLPPLVGILLAVLVCTALGILIERLAYKPLRAAPSLAVLITAIGMSYFLQNAAQLLWSSNPKVFPSVFGGIGSIPGALLGGVLLGIIEILSSAYISTELSNAIVFAVLIVILLVKPTGLLGKKIREKV